MNCVCAFTNCRGDDDVDANGRDRRLGKPVMGHAIGERVLLFGTRSADYIRASSHSGCIEMEVSPPFENRPYTWLHPNASQISQIPLAPRAPSIHGPSRHAVLRRVSVASLIGRSGSSTFRLSTAAVSMSHAGSCFSSDSAPRPFHHGSRGQGGTIFRAALPSDEWQVQATERTHLIHRPARDIFPPQGGARVSSYRM